MNVNKLNNKALIDLIAIVENQEIDKLEQSPINALNSKISQYLKLYCGWMVLTESEIDFDNDKNLGSNLTKMEIKQKVVAFCFKDKTYGIIIKTRFGNVVFHAKSGSDEVYLDAPAMIGNCFNLGDEVTYKLINTIIPNFLPSGAVTLGINEAIEYFLIMADKAVAEVNQNSKESTKVS